MQTARRPSPNLGGRLALVGLALLIGACDRVRVRVEDYFIHDRVTDAIGPVPRFRNGRRRTETVRVAMRDGVELETHVYLPQGDGPWPTIVVRDPYLLSQYVTCWLYVQYGYACVHQDVRGRHGSQGEWYPLVHERDDGIDTLAWVLEQPWQNGKLALSGESYVGLVQWAMADRLPAEVRTLVVNVAHGDFYDMIYRSEQFMPSIVGAWSAGLFAPMDQLAEAMDAWRTRVLPASPPHDVDPEIFGAAWPSYRDYLDHHSKDDPYWNGPVYRAIRDGHRGLRVPILWTARWYDFFLEGTLRRFDELPAREGSVLVIGPGDHSGKIGDLPVDHGPESAFADSIAWLDHFLADGPRPDALRPGFRIYENGADRWHHYDAWPPPTEARSWRLADLGASRDCDGGALVAAGAGAAEASATSVSYVYDPSNPVPSRGGSWSLSPNLSPTANVEQGSDLCARPDVLSFSTGPLSEPIHVAGSIDVRLEVASEAPDTAFFVKVSERFTDGRVLNVREDVLTLARGRRTPDGRTELRFHLVPIDWQTSAGSRLRLDVTSSSFPAFQPHPNRVGPWSEVADPVPAVQTVFGGSLAVPEARLPSGAGSDDE